ncbi:MAG: hypothetical protein ACUVV4_02465 [Candidatus Bathyarchaeia archaeon]
MFKHVKPETHNWDLISEPSIFRKRLDAHHGLRYCTGNQHFYLAIACSCIVYFLWNYALSKLETVKMVIWLYMEPVAAL